MLLQAREAFTLGLCSRTAETSREHYLVFFGGPRCPRVYVQFLYMYTELPQSCKERGFDWERRKKNVLAFRVKCGTYLLQFHDEKYLVRTAFIFQRPVHIFCRLNICYIRFNLVNSFLFVVFVLRMTCSSTGSIQCTLIQVLSKT